MFSSKIKAASALPGGRKMIIGLFRDSASQNNFNSLKNFSQKLSAVILLIFLFPHFISALSDEKYFFGNIAVVNGNIFTMEENKPEIIKGTILINGKSISKILNSDDKIPEGYKIIDAKDKYIIPGLVDMHIHTTNKDDFISYLNYGVTTIYNLRGTDYLLNWSDSVESGKWIAPQILSSSPIIDSTPMTAFYNMPIDTKEDAEKAVELFKKKGYHGIKVYNNLNPFIYKYILELAEQNNLAVVGHIPVKVGIENTVKWGQKMIVHAEEFFHNYFMQNNRYPSEKDCEYFALLMKENGVWLTPNSSAVEFMLQAAKDINFYLKQDETKYISSNVFHNWQPQNNTYSTRTNKMEFIFILEKLLEFDVMMIKQARLHDVNITAGTDVTVTGFPGLWLHKDIEYMKKGGFANYDALKTATKNPGEFVGKYLDESIKLGMIKENYRADLLILDDNPINDLKNLMEIETVILNGKLITKENLKKLRKNVSRINENLHKIISEFEELKKNKKYKEILNLIEKTYAEYSSRPVFDFGVLYKYGNSLLQTDNREIGLKILEITGKWYSGI